MNLYGKIILFVVTLCSSTCKHIRLCDSKIFCQGKLLDTIQMSQIFEESKTFVDLKLREPPEVVYKKFLEFMLINSDTPSVAQIKHFVDDHFEGLSTEMEKWQPKDWRDNPAILKRFSNRTITNWMTELHGLWNELGRKIKDDVNIHPELYSMIWVPNPFIVPGGRFREYYYWDSYWIILGLLVSEMYLTVRGMLENFLYLVLTEHHVPNGGRIYYLDRSQPPLLIPMVDKYYEFTSDKNFLVKYVSSMEEEYRYWMEYHMQKLQDGKTKFATYGHASMKPRPESYIDDVTVTRNESSEEYRWAFYKEIRAAAESGWDFSSRWFVTGTNRLGTFRDLKTTIIAPVDLNAILCWNTKILAKFYRILGVAEKSREYNLYYEEWVEKIEKFMYNEEHGVWFDYNIVLGRSNTRFYPSNFAPLWTGCYRRDRRDEIAKRAVKYLKSTQVAVFPGGIPASLYNSGEQWDFPNCWPPLQHMMIIGLLESGDAEAKKIAFEMAQKWVRNNFLSYSKTKTLFEKYDAMQPGVGGGGGDYEAQAGFGWTYGVILDLIYRFDENLFYDYFDKADLREFMVGKYYPDVGKGLYFQNDDDMNMNLGVILSIASHQDDDELNSTARRSKFKKLKHKGSATRMEPKRITLFVVAALVLLVC